MNTKDTAKELIEVFKVDTGINDIIQDAKYFALTFITETMKLHKSFYNDGILAKGQLMWLNGFYDEIKKEIINYKD